MTNREFCYWLQGFFELSRAIKENDNFGLGPEQVMIIKNHISLARKVDKKLEEFPSWLEGFLDSNCSDGATGIHDASKISAKLNAIFKHDIDPSYPGDQTELNDIHSGGGFNPGGCGHDHLIRC